MANTRPETALIVGGSSGMGKETAARLLDRGNAVMILGHDDTKLEQTRNDFAGKGEVETVRVDLLDTAAVDVFIEQCGRSLQAQTVPRTRKERLRQVHGL